MGFNPQYFAALKLMKKYAPDVVLGFGGYPSGPGGIASKLAGVPLVIHEQNAIPGLTNKLLARIATKTYVAFSLAQEAFQQKGIATDVIGNPIRDDIQPKAHCEKKNSALTCWSLRQLRCPST